MGSQFLMSILKDSGVADVAVSIVDYLVDRKAGKSEAGKTDKAARGNRKSEAGKQAGTEAEV